MSADNWTICPKCKKETDSRVSKVEAQYGKVSVEKYKSLMDEAMQEKEQEDTLCEDYEIGIYNGKFEIVYSSSCHECGFSFNYKFEKDPLTK